MSEFRHIVRLAGCDIDGSLKLPHALIKIKGIGHSLAHAIVKVSRLDPNKQIGYLSNEDLAALESIIKDPVKYGVMPYMVNRQRDPQTGENRHLVGSDLELQIKMDIEFMKKIKCWKGIRHALGLKVRGQRTRTTGRKGITVGVTKKAK